MNMYEKEKNCHFHQLECVCVRGGGGGSGGGGERGGRGGNSESKKLKKKHFVGSILHFLKFQRRYLFA